jgi:chitodextrinase
MNRTNCDGGPQQREDRVPGRRTIVAAALVGAIGVGVGITTLAHGAETIASPDVTLQVAPRGLGSVSSDPPGRDSDGQPVSECTKNLAQHACEWRYKRGTTVTLTASPDAATGRRLARWSSADCPGAGTCNVALDDDLTSIVALFTPMRLAVRLSNATAGTVSADPLGTECKGDLHDPTPDLCREFAAGTRVTLTVQTRSPHSFNAWSPGCAVVTPGSCAVTVLDEATWVGASFDDDKLPVLPTTITVQFRLHKRGDGRGRVTGSGLDCGSECGAQYDYGTSLTLTAVPGRGSLFDGWNDRVCAPTRKRCTIPVGPVTAIAARFARPPRAPASLRVRRRTRTSISIAWSASTGGAHVARYRVYLNGVGRGRTARRSYRFRRLKCGRRYRMAVAAIDARGHRSRKKSIRGRTALCARR